MMALEDRVERLEEESRQTRQLVTTCMQTAQNALVAHEQNRVLLNALAEVQGNHTFRLNTIDGRLGRIETRLDGVETRLGRVETRLDRVETRLDRIETRLDDHDRRFDEIDRRFDAVDKRFEAVDKRFEAVDRRFDTMEQQLSDMRGTIGKVAVGMYTLEKLIRRIVPADDTD
jgi:chromosome segregation ATPase